MNVRNDRLDSLPYLKNTGVWLQKLTDEIESLTLILSQVPDNGSLGDLYEVWSRTLLGNYFSSYEQLNTRSLSALRTTLEAQKYCLSMWQAELSHSSSYSGVLILGPEHRSDAGRFGRFVSELSEQSGLIGPKTLGAFDVFLNNLSTLRAEK